MRDERPLTAHHDALLRALVRAAAPRSVVEVAAPHASRARLVVESAGASLASLELIGVESETALSELRGSTSARVETRDGLTLNALAALTEPPDLVLLGGDPNWYTVFHALRLLARLAGDGPFPLTIVRDTGWPYGRRDAYPAPHAIPGAYLLPHTRSGVRPGKVELDHAGLFADANHAVFENTEKNGVRTAVDDFLAQREGALELVVVPGFHGLAILVDPRRVEGNDTLSALVRDLAVSAPIQALLDELERARVDGQLELAALHAKSQRRAAERTELMGRLAELRAAHDRVERELAEALENAHRRQLRAAELEASKQSLEELAATLERDLRDARGRIADLTATNKHLESSQARAAERERVLADLESQLAAARRREASGAHRPASEPPLRTETAEKAARKRENGVSKKKLNGANGSVTFTRALAGTGLVDAAALELASRRLAKLRRDPKLFLAHSRFEIARKLSRFL